MVAVAEPEPEIQIAAVPEEGLSAARAGTAAGGGGSCTRQRQLYST